MAQRASTDVHLQLGSVPPPPPVSGGGGGGIWHRELQVFPDNPGMRWPLKFEMSILDLDKNSHFLPNVLYARGT